MGLKGVTRLIRVRGIGKRYLLMTDWDRIWICHQGTNGRVESSSYFDPFNRQLDD